MCSGFFINMLDVRTKGRQCWLTHREQGQQRGTVRHLSLHFRRSKCTVQGETVVSGQDRPLIHAREPPAYHLSPTGQKCLSTLCLCLLLLLRLLLPLLRLLLPLLLSHVPHRVELPVSSLSSTPGIDSNCHKAHVVNQHLHKQNQQQQYQYY